MKIEINGVKGVEQYLDRIQNYAKAEKKRLLADAANIAEEAMVKAAPQGASSHLSQSIIQVTTINGVKIGPTVEYAVYVNDGTPPRVKLPAIAPLIDWVRYKLGIKDEKEAKSVAFAVAKTIKKNGTKGSRFVEFAEKVTWKYLKHSIKQANRSFKGVK